MSAGSAVAAPMPRRTPIRDELAALVLDRALGAPLPPPLPGERGGVVAALEATRLAPSLLRAIERIYGVASWDRRTFRRFFLEGALAAWKPGSTVHEQAGALRVRSPVCPLAALAAMDPRFCERCRLAQGFAARLAMPGRVRRIAFEQTVARGDPACVVVLETEEAEA